jgi:hypothetical protein
MHNKDLHTSTVLPEKYGDSVKAVASVKSACRVIDHFWNNLSVWIYAFVTVYTQSYYFNNKKIHQVDSKQNQKDMRAPNPNIKSNISNNVIDQLDDKRLKSSSCNRVDLFIYHI